jgi:outer membrane protein assembly factor BamE (lipoprotein component of BamABCDE complex)
MNKPFFTIKLSCLVLFLAITACHQKQKFDKEKWNYGDGIDYPLRDDQLEDLINDHQLKGMTYHQVIKLLGSPQDTGKLRMSYQIINTGHEYNPKLRPIYIKNLDFYINKDSIVTKAEVYEHRNKK